MFNHTGRWMMSAGLLALSTACGSSDEVEQQVESQAKLATVPQVITDAKGNRFVHVRQVTPSAPAYGPDKLRVVPERRETAPDKDYDAMSLEELAQALRPIMLRDGHEYILEKPDLEFARRVREAAHTAQRTEGHPGQGMGDGAPAELDASVGGLSVIGVDSRELRRDNTYYPFSTQVNLSGNGWGCSGTMVGPSTMISAASCFHDGINWKPPPLLGPGADSQDANPFPFGRFGCYDVTIPGGYNGSISEDYAVVEFGTGCGSYPGNLTGWLGMWAASDSVITGRANYLYGYPGDKGSYPQIWGMGMTGTTTSFWYPARLFYSIDTSGGQSGSGLYLFEGSDRYVVGIHYGNFDSDENQARRLDSTVFNFVLQYSSL